MIRYSHSKAMIGGGSMGIPAPVGPLQGAVRRRQSSQPSRHTQPSSSSNPTPGHLSTSLGRVTAEPPAAAATSGAASGNVPLD